VILKNRNNQRSPRNRESIYLVIWGFALVVSSFIFLYVGYRIDQVFRTEPFFMIGLFLLAVMICVGKFYQVVWRKWAEQELRVSEQRLYSILQGSPIPTFVLGKDHRVIYWNTAVEVLTNIRAKDVIGTTYHWKAFYSTERPCMADLLVDESVEAIPQWYSGACSKSKLIDEAYEGMDFFPVLGEKGKWLRFTAAMIRNSSGNPIGAVETLEDITEQKRAEDELVKMKKLESLGILADGIAHDFGSLLSAILRNIFLAKISVTDEDKSLEQGLEIAEKASLQAKELTKRLITFSKGGNPIRKPAPIAPLLREMAATTIRDTAIYYQLDLPDDLWNVDMDVSQIKQVVQNLLSNAREAMQIGGIVHVRAKNIAVSSGDSLPLREGRYVKWSVEDHGIGIPMEHREKLFEPYFTTKQKSDSTGIGLGLAMCYAIVKKHDGCITVQSEPRVGTIVDVYLPAALMNGYLENNNADEFAVSIEKILVMDHDEVMRDAAEIMLHFLGYDCDFARDPEEALRYYRKAWETNRPYTAVILDSTAPGELGVENILQALLYINPHVKAIIAGGDVHHPLLTEYPTHGFSGAVVRPYTIDDLKAALNPQQ
jgi:signal transduction histidine kinase/F0F1-type ATP synthase assembly protein I